MKKWRAPPLSTWSAELFFVCFNDECSYYRRGWKGLEEGTGTGCSYLHHFDPEGMSGSLVVAFNPVSMKRPWSGEAARPMLYWIFHRKGAKVAKGPFLSFFACFAPLR